MRLCGEPNNKLVIKHYDIIKPLKQDKHGVAALYSRCHLRYLYVDIVNELTGSQAI